MSEKIQIPMSEKEKYCQELEKFIQDTDILLQKACSDLGLNLNQIINKTKEPHITCPFNEGHRVPERTIEKHLISCEWKALGYTKECKPLPEPSLPPGHPSSIKFDMQLQHKVLQLAKERNPELNIGIDEKLIPQTSDRLTCDFSRDEKKVLYEYVLANTVAPDMGQDIADMNKAEKTDVKSTPIIELLAQERNLKRRRAKHRGVHTNKKSQTEILKEIIEQQMEMYKEHISEKFGIAINDDTEENCLKTYKNEVKELPQKVGECSYTQSKQDNTKYFEKDIPSHDYDDNYDTKYYHKSQSSKSLYDKDYNTKSKYFSDYKYSSLNRSGKEQENQSFSRHYSKDYHENCDKYDSHDRKRDKKYDRHEFSNTKSIDKVESNNQNYDLTDSNNPKKHKAKDKKHNKKPRHDSEDRKSYKKHKKHHKRKRESSCDSTTNSKHHKSSKSKRD